MGSDAKAPAEAGRAEGAVDGSSASASMGGADRLAIALATFGGAGLAPVAPGTFGSLAGVLLFWALLPLGALAGLGVLGLVSVLGVWASHRAERVYRKADDGRVVIDEVSGQLIALAPLWVPGLFDASPVSTLGWVVTAFVAFRGFDIAKPGPVGWAERRFRGGVGVMADDWVAGGLAAALLVAARFALPVVGIDVGGAA